MPPGQAVIPDKHLAEILAQRMHAGVPLPVPIALSILQQVCNGLEYAHSMRDPEGRSLGIVHGDVSPAHIYVTEGGVVTLVGRMTQNGTFAYMAPEYVTAGMIDARADLFALGVVAHEMFTNRTLFAGSDDRETLDRVCQLPIPPASASNPLVPPDLDGVVFTALSRDPAYRWQSAGMMRDAFLGTAQRLGIEVAAPDHPMWADVIAGRFEQPAPVPGRPPRGLYDPPPAGQFDAAPPVQFQVPAPRFTPVPPAPASLPSPTRPAASFEAEATVEVSSLKVPTPIRAPDPPVEPALEPEEEPATLSPGSPASAARGPEVWTDDDDGSTRIQPLDPAFLEEVSAAAAARPPTASPVAAVATKTLPTVSPITAPRPSGAPPSLAPPRAAPVRVGPTLVEPPSSSVAQAPSSAAPTQARPPKHGGASLAGASPVAPRPLSGPESARPSGPIARGPKADLRTPADPPVARGPAANDRTLADRPGLVAPVPGPRVNNGFNGAADSLAPVAGRASTEQDLPAEDALAPVERAATIAEQEFEGSDDEDREPADAVAPIGRTPRGEQLAPVSRGARDVLADGLAPVGRGSRGGDQLAPVARGRTPSVQPSATGRPLADAPLAPELANDLAAELAAAGARASSTRVARATASPVVRPVAAPPVARPVAPPEPEPVPEAAQPVPQNQFDPELGPEPTQIGAMPLIAFGDVPLVSKIGENARRVASTTLPAPSATFLPEQPEPPTTDKKKLAILIGAGVLVLVLILVIILIAR